MVIVKNDFLISYHQEIDKFLDAIRSIKSGNPEVLPQRSNFGYQDDDYNNRIVNSAIYSNLKDTFVMEELLLKREQNYSGLYFFYTKNSHNNKYFYIGKADNLFNRVSKHFLTFDYFFYSASFPHNYEKYYSDCMKFYAEGIYNKNEVLYKRQFKCFKDSPFNEIGWISCDEFKDPELLKLVEKHSIYYYKPCANGTKGSMKGNSLSINLFEKIRTEIKDWFNST